MYEFEHNFVFKIIFKKSWNFLGFFSNNTSLTKWEGVK
jgi:hypothetical protein